MTTKTKGTGTVETCRDAKGKVYYRGKVRLQDDTLARVRIDEPKCFSKTASKDFIAFCQEDEDATHEIYNARVAKKTKVDATVAGAAGETCDAWYLRFMAYRRQEVGSVDDDGWRWTKWLSPRIGAKPIRDVSPDDIEDIRDLLTASVLAYEAGGNVKGERLLAPKTAQNVWASLTTPFKYASTRVVSRENPWPGSRGLSR